MQKHQAKKPSTLRPVKAVAAAPAPPPVKAQPEQPKPKPKLKAGRTPEQYRLWLEQRIDELEAAVVKLQADPSQQSEAKGELRQRRDELAKMN